jgi:acyl-CoA dehydrogenase
MDFKHSDRALDWHARVRRFLDEQVIPREAEYFAQVREDSNRQPPVMETMKAAAKEAGLWNMFLPGEHGAGLTNLEYAPLAEMMGRHLWSAEVFNCNGARHRQHGSAPYATEMLAQQARWLKPADGRRDPLGLPDDRAGGRQRPTPPISRPGSSATATTMSSTAANGGRLGRGPSESGKVDHRHGQDRPRQRQPPTPSRSQVIVPPDTPGFVIERMLSVFGYDEKPRIGHAEVVLEGRARAGRERSDRWARAGASRSPRAAWAPAVSTTACARSARRSVALETDGARGC